MADVLDQSEVDALLVAVDSSTVDEAQSEVFTRTKAKTADVSAYDFKRPERVSKDQMRALEALHDGFARNFGASLSAYLRTIVEVRQATAEQLTYGEFIHSLPTPTCFNLLDAPPLKGQMCLEISPPIIYPIIERLLGGSSSEMFIPQRPLTLIEQRLAARIMDQALVCLTEVWSGLIDLKFHLHETESNPHLVQIVAPSDVVVVIGFEIKMGTRAGTMSFCIPFNVIEPLMGKLTTQSWLAYQGRADQENVRKKTSSSLRRAEIELEAYLAETTITLGELRNLRPGDVIKTDKSANAEVIVRAEGRNKYAGRLGHYKGKQAVKITREADPEEPL